MISKKCFCKIIDSCEKFYEKFDQLMDLLNIAPETFILSFFDDILDSLVDELEDVEELDKLKLDPIIYSYTFEHKFGKEYSEDDYIIKIDDIKYQPKNSEELYNILLWGRS